MFQRIIEFARVLWGRGDASLREDSFEAAVCTTETSDICALGIEPISRLFMRYATISLMGVVAQIAMVASEGIVVGNGIGPAGLACMSVVMMFELVNMALGSSLGQGVSTVCGNLLGAGNVEAARRAFGQGFWFTFLLASAVSATFFVFAPAIVPYVGATPDIHGDCVMAVRIFMMGYPFCITGQMLCQMLRQDERPGLASAVQTMGSVLAAVWLVTSVFVLHLGVAGAAAYYAISTGFWFVSVLAFIGGRRAHVFHIRLSDISVSPKLAIDVCRYGCPVFLVQISSALYVAMMNHSFAVTRHMDAVASFAIINSYFMYTLNIVCMALAYALQPIAAYNEGAGKRERLAQLLLVASLVEVFVVGLVSVSAMVFAPQLCAIFAGRDVKLAMMSARCVRIVLLFCSLGSLGQILSAYFESVGATKRAVLFGVLRYALFAVPAILVIDMLAGPKEVWWVLPFADLATFAVSVAWISVERRRLLG